MRSKKIKIISSNKSERKKVADALTFIKKHHPNAWKLLLNLKSIVVIQKRGYDNALFPTLMVYICKSGTVKGYSIAGLAGLLVHEARHIWQYKNHKKWCGDSAEKDVYLFQQKFLLKFGTQKEMEWLDKQFKKKWWKNTGSKSARLLKAWERNF